MKDEEYTDILIVGCGLVGATMLCALESLIQRYHLHVTLVESKPVDFNVLNQSDKKALALSYGTKLIYERLGLWECLAQYATPILNVHVSDKNHFGYVDFDCQDEQLSALGYVVESFHLKNILLKKVKQLKQQGIVNFLSSSQVVNVTPQPDTTNVIEIQSENEKRVYRSKLTVLADGGQSDILNRLHIACQAHDYQQQALITNVSIEKKHNGVAYERFMDQESIALLPLGDIKNGHRYGLVWIFSTQNIQSYLTMDSMEFISQLHSSFNLPHINFLDISDRKAYSLQSKMAQEQVRHGLVVLGNAAHVVHPIAAQGYNLSLRDTMALVDNIQQSLEANLSIGHLQQLLQYVKVQENDQNRTSIFCDQVVKLFNRKEKSVVLTRNLGLHLLNKSDCLKHRFVRMAMGL